MLSSQTKQKINNCRDYLVGKVPDPKGQVDQITNALIYKFMAYQDKESVNLGGKASFFIEEYEIYSWFNLFDNTKNNQEKSKLYVKGIDKLSKASHLPKLFREIFKDALIPFRDPNTIVSFLMEIDKFDYANSEELGNAFEYLLSIMGSQGDAGQFRTPRHIIDFIVEVVEPKPGQTIYDPACGTAGFLMSAYKYIISNNKLTVTQKIALSKNISGVDIDPGMAKIARVNLFLHGFKSPNIHENNTLTNPVLWDKKYDIILANPPFMTPKGGVITHDKYILKSTRAEVLFVNYISEHLRIGGGGAIIVPDGIVSSNNSHVYSDIRKDLLNNSLWGIISLPAGVFEPYSKVKTWILLLDRAINNEMTEIIFLNIKNDGYSLNTKRKKEEINTIPEAIKTLLKWKKEKKKIKNDASEWINKDKILSTPEAYLYPGAYNSLDKVKEGYVKIGDLLEPSKSGKVNGILDVPVMSITMKHGLIDQSDKFKKRIANTDISKYKLVKKNELVVGFPIDEGVLGFQKKYKYAAVSPAYGVWSLKSDVNIESLELILRSTKARDIYLSLLKGTANRRRVVTKDVFLNIQIPDPNSGDFEITDNLLKNKKELQEEIKTIDISINKGIEKMWNLGQDFENLKKSYKGIEEDLKESH